ncbi:hypothetical protein PR048_028316 [Dryococelus australis]|uniref:C-type lectin domain-containing protein n=1 Tax=Dryococelus australis TaxID=614101 RepID=A0ABQ9GIY5_9NEOP|nr:hypothetical protein PR048_028316 [Dryococelus australis]
MGVAVAGDNKLILVTIVVCVQPSDAGIQFSHLVEVSGWQLEPVQGRRRRVIGCKRQRRQLTGDDIVANGFYGEGRGGIEVGREQVGVWWGGNGWGCRKLDDGSIGWEERRPGGRRWKDCRVISGCNICHNDWWFLAPAPKIRAPEAPSLRYSISPVICSNQLYHNSGITPLKLRPSINHEAPFSYDEVTPNIRMTLKTGSGGGCPPSTAAVMYQLRGREGTMPSSPPLVTLQDLSPVIVTLLATNPIPRFSLSCNRGLSHGFPRFDSVVRGMLAAGGSGGIAEVQCSVLVAAVPVLVEGNKSSGRKPDNQQYVAVDGVGQYKLHTNPRTWEDARKKCTSEDGHLAIINSEAEVKALLAIWQQNTRLTNYFVFLGFNDLNGEGHYVTVKGKQWYPSFIEEGLRIIRRIWSAIALLKYCMWSCMKE